MIDALSSKAQAWMWPFLAPLLMATTFAQAQFGAQSVGINSATQTIQVTATIAGTVSRMEVLTLGSPNGDFSAAAGPSNCAAANLVLGGTCTQPVFFTPAASGLRMGAVVLVGTRNGADVVLGVTYLSGTGTGESSAPIPDDTSRATGQTAGYDNFVDGSTAVDGAGNVYAADAGNNRILMVCGTAATPIIHGTTCAAAGEVSTIAGDGTAAYTGDNGSAAIATLNHPEHVAIDGAGNLLIADTGNNSIRIVNAVTGAISTIAGNANGTICAGATNSIGDGCPANEATLNQPQGVTLDGAGNLAIADIGNDAIRFVNRATHVISTVTVASTTTSITSSLDPSGFGQSVIFTVTASAASGTGNLTGTVTLSDKYNGAAITLASGLPLNASGAATFSISTLAVGQHSITASYNNANDPSYKASTSPALIETVLEGTAVSLTPSANPSEVGQSVTLTAAVVSLGGGVTPTGTVTFYDDSAVLITATINANGAASYTTFSLANGAHLIVAGYSGDSSSEIEGSTSPAIDENVQAPSSIVVSSNLNPSTYGVAVAFTATITSSATSPATGSVSFFDNGVSIGAGTLAGNPVTASLTISTLRAGTHRITAAYAGDSKNQASNSSTSPLNQTVVQAQTVTTLSAAPASGIAGIPETFTAAVQLAQGSAPLTGMVNFSSGSTLLGTAQLNTSGVAFITPTLAAGSYQIVATYQGDTNTMGSASDVPACSTASPTFCSSSGPLLYIVTPVATQTALTVSSGAALAASPIVFTATISTSGAAPTGSVNFLANGVVIGTSALNSGTATFTDASLPAGSYAMTAEYLGNANDAISTSTSVAETVNAIPTTTALVSTTTTGSDPQVTLTATVTSNGSKLEPAGTVTFLNGETPLGKATLDANGVAALAPILVKDVNYSIDAVYGGDAYHGSSASPILSVAGVASGFIVSVAPSSVALSSAQTATVTVTITSVTNFTDTIALSCASLPAMANCRFAAATLNLPAGGSAITQLTISAGNTQKAQAAAIYDRMSGESISLAGSLLPFGFVLGCFYRKSRIASTRVLATFSILVLAATALAATGCGAVLNAVASPGNYIIEVTGTGVTSSVVRSQNVNLNIAR